MKPIFKKYGRYTKFVDNSGRCRCYNADWGDYVGKVSGIDHRYIVNTGSPSEATCISRQYDGLNNATRTATEFFESVTSI